MSKLTIVREALDSNAEVIVLGVKEQLYFPEPNGLWTQTVDFVVAPRDGLYTADELQTFMMGLVPLETSCKDVFYHDGGTRLSFGKLYFDETIGTEIVTGQKRITITDPDITLPNSCQDNSATISLNETIARQRRTWVRVFPDIEYAERARNGRDVSATADFRSPSRAFSSSAH